MANSKISMQHLSEELKQYLSNLASPSGGASYVNDMLEPIKRNVQLNTSDLREAEGRISANETAIASIRNTMAELNTEAITNKLEQITASFSGLFNEDGSTISLGKMDPSIIEKLGQVASALESIENLSNTVTQNSETATSSIQAINSNISAINSELSEHKTVTGKVISGLDERLQSIESWQTEQQNNNGLITEEKLAPEVRSILEKTNEINTLKENISNLSESIGKVDKMLNLGIRGDFLSIINNKFSTKSLVNRISVASSEKDFALLKEGKRNKIFWNNKLYIGSDIMPEDVNEEAMTEEELAEWNRQKEAKFYYKINENGLLDEKYNYSFVWDEDAMRLLFNENGVLTVLPVNTSTNDALNEIPMFSLTKQEIKDVNIEDPIKKNVKVFVLDDDENSETHGKWINAEGVCTLAYGTNVLTVKNDSDATVNIRIIY